MIGGAEPDAPDTWRFSIDVAVAWEKALNETPVPATRKVLLRSAMTMSPDRGGIFDTLLALARNGLGGTGDGRHTSRGFTTPILFVPLFFERDDIEARNLASPTRRLISEFRRRAAAHGVWAQRSAQKDSRNCARLPKT